MHRRLFLGGLSGVLAGCRPPEAQRLPHPLDLGVDAHIHLFNGRDVPAFDFLRRVVFTDKDGLPKDTPFLSLVALMVAILGIDTPKAEEERKGIPPRGLAEDEARVAAGLDAFMAQAAPQRLRGDGERDDARLLDMLRAEVGGDAATMAQRPAAGDGTDLARRIYAQPPAAQPLMRGAGRTRFSLSGHIRWAGLMTRGRRDLMEEVLRLYHGGGPGQFEVFIASLVDLEHWLDTPADWLSDPDELLMLMSALSRAREDVLILNFAPFCPLRVAIEGPAAMARLRHAVEDLGFAGVKLYPPMGFRPTCNDGIFVPAAGITPEQIDAALSTLYAWCADNDVPIQAHANDSMAARPGTGAYASPVYWERVLDTHKRLRVNLSHAGFVPPDTPSPTPTVCGIAQESDWPAVIARMIGKGQSVWFDTGHWADLAAAGRHEEAIERLHALARDHAPEMFPRRVLYGSDWMMIARLPGHAGYHAGMQRFIEAVYPDPKLAGAVMGGNALDFVLGPRRGQNYDRLARFYARNAVWRRIAGA